MVQFFVAANCHSWIEDDVERRRRRRHVNTIDKDMTRIWSPIGFPPTNTVFNWANWPEIQPNTTCSVQVELIQLCMFTCWLPIMYPLILRMVSNNVPLFICASQCCPDIHYLHVRSCHIGWAWVVSTVKRIFHKHTTESTLWFPF